MVKPAQTQPMPTWRLPTGGASPNACPSVRDTDLAVQLTAALTRSRGVQIVSSVDYAVGHAPCRVRQYEKDQIGYVTVLDPALRLTVAQYTNMGSLTQALLTDLRNPTFAYVSYSDLENGVPYTTLYPRHIAYTVPVPARMQRDLDPRVAMDSWQTRPL